MADLRFNALDIKTFIPLYMKYLLDPEYPNTFSYQYIQARKNGDPHWDWLELKIFQLPEISSVKEV